MITRPDLGSMVSIERKQREISLREAGQEIGVSAGTVGRIENWFECNSTTFQKVLKWLGFSILSKID